jgi:stage IV sporulation protein FB
MPVRIRIHRSFFQLFFLLLLVVALQRRGAEGMVQFLAGFGVLFLAVVLHEISHAFVATRLGVTVRDIVLHPLGGMTRLEWSARDPRKEALISSAGPALNLLLALATWSALRLFDVGPGRLLSWVLQPLLFVNLALGALNLVPAFPMDGGRILRALLATRRGHLPATRIAVRVGRWFAGLALAAPFLALAVGWSFWQALVFPVLGLFVFVLGEIELKQAEAADLLARMGAAGAPRAPGGTPDVIDVAATSRVVDPP